MTILPIVERELRVASRRPATFWIRLLAATAVLLMVGWLLMVTQDEPPERVGKILFYLLTICGLTFCTLAGVRSTSDCLSEEKRDGTLGLLFLTDLKGYDVVLGKLVSSSMGALYCLLAALPMVGLPLLMGGTAAGEAVRMMILLLVSLLFSLSVGIFCSAFMKSSRKSAGLTFTLLLLFSGACPVAGLWANAVTRSREFDALYLPSPAFCYWTAQDRSWLRLADQFYLSLGTIHGLTWLFLILAVWIVPHSWQDRPAGARAARWLTWWRQLQSGEVGSGRTRVRMLDQNPFFWLSSRVRSVRAMVWASLGIVAVLWTWGAVRFGRNWLETPLYVATGFFLNSMLKCWIGNEACRQLIRERRQGSLELLLTTPLSVPAILRGQGMALWRQFFWPMLVVICVEFMMMVEGLHDMSGNEGTWWITLWVLALVLLVADSVAMYWVGMWMALSTKNPRNAYSQTVRRVLIMPWIAFAVMLLFLGISRTGSPEYLLLGAWFVFGLLADIGYASWAKNNLLTQFRSAAAQKYSQRPSLLERLLRG